MRTRIVSEPTFPAVVTEVISGSFLSQTGWQDTYRYFASRFLSYDLSVRYRSGETDLFCLQSGVPEGGYFNEQVAIPLDGLDKLDIERFTCRGNHVAIRKGYLPCEGPCCASNHGDPVAASELDREGIVR